MKMLSPLRTPFRSVAVATFALTALSLPTLAQASDYYRHNDTSRACKAKENETRIIGAVLGAVLGGVIGSEVSGNGARTEGSAIGAVLGGLAGAGIADEAVDCDKTRRRAYNSNSAYNQSYNRGYNNGYQPTRHTTTYPQPNNYRYRNDRSRHDTSYGNQNGHYLSDSDLRRLDRVENNLQDVTYRLRNLRKENRRLERRAHNDHSHWLERRRQEVCNEIDRLKSKKRRLQKRKRRILNG